MATLTRADILALAQLQKKRGKREALSPDVVKKYNALVGQDFLWSSTYNRFINLLDAYDCSGNELFDAITLPLAQLSGPMMLPYNLQNKALGKSILNFDAKGNVEKKSEKILSFMHEQKDALQSYWNHTKQTNKAAKEVLAKGANLLCLVNDSGYHVVFPLSHDDIHKNLALAKHGVGFHTADFARSTQYYVETVALINSYLNSSNSFVREFTDSLVSVKFNTDKELFLSDIVELEERISQKTHKLLRTSTQFVVDRAGAYAFNSQPI